MTSVTFDTLKYAEALKTAGLPDVQAKAQAEALADALRQGGQDLATKADITELRRATRADLAEVRADIAKLHTGPRLGQVDRHRRGRDSTSCIRSRSGSDNDDNPAGKIGVELQFSPRVVLHLFAQRGLITSEAAAERRQSEQDGFSLDAAVRIEAAIERDWKGCSVIARGRSLPERADLDKAGPTPCILSRNPHPMGKPR